MYGIADQPPSGVHIHILKSTSVGTKPFEGQKPGTSGLRKEVKVFKQLHYTENFIQCILEAMGDDLSGSLLVVGGDGRYYGREAVNKIIKICAANGVRMLTVGQNGVMSTPSVSCVIRKHGYSGGIVLTASHNPGGPHGDFGIKFNVANGGPAPENVTNYIYELSRKIGEYRICSDLICDISEIGINDYTVDGRPFRVKVVDPVSDYVDLMKEIFNFNAIKDHLKSGFKIIINCMHGVTGIYAKRIFADELGAPADHVVESELLEDFGGHHPDPNRTYAADLIRAMEEGDYDFGAAFDGDGDRNMVLGHKAFFVTPSDSLAVLAANLECIPYFQRTGVKGYARSMPTAGAVDRVAAYTHKECFEVPTGWKYFGNLMDAGRLSICGEESFGTGSDHIREKDGIWAVLAWLSVLASRKQSVKDIVYDHWSKFGRNFFTRYDYENCDAGPSEQMMIELERLISDRHFEGKEFNSRGKIFIVQKADNFRYVDPVDGSIAENQGIRIHFKDGSRIVVRLSGTGSSGATIRLYMDSYESDPAKQRLGAEDMLLSLVELTLQITHIRELTGRQEPTVIT